MKTKKLLAGVLSCMMFACAFTACGDKDKDSEKSSGGKKDDYMSYAEDHINKITQKNSGEVFFTAVLPDDVIAAYKDNNKWKDIVANYNDDRNSLLDDSRYENIKVEEVGELSEKQLKDAEKVFLAQIYYYLKTDEFLNNKYNIKRGYEVQESYDVVSNEDDSLIKSMTTRSCILDIDGNNDWKVLSYETDLFDKYVDKYEELKNQSE